MTWKVLRPLQLLPRSDALPGDHPSWQEAAKWTGQERRTRLANAFPPGPERVSITTINYEAQQPPLFYALAAVPIRWMPWLPADRMLGVLRGIATLLAAFAVPIAHGFFRRLLPPDGALAATAAFVACPGLGSFVGRFSNDALALPIAAALLILLADAARGDFSPRRAIVFSALLAAGCWTKLYFLPLIPAGPLAALAAPAHKRNGTLRRCLMASGAGAIAIGPWLVHRYRETGDWLGMHSAIEAATLRIGIVDRLRAIAELFHPRFLAVLGRTFLWPGTWSAMGAPASLALLIGTGFGLLFLGGLARSITRASPLRGRMWWGSASALVLFLLAYIAYASTIAAVGRRAGTPASAGPDGWYVLILLPLLLTAGCMTGGRMSSRLFTLAVAIFVFTDAFLALGVLPAVYDGRSLPNGANAPLAVWSSLAMTPSRGLETLSRNGLLAISAWELGAMAAAYPVLLGVGLWLARRVKARRGKRPLLPAHAGVRSA